jgi:hypothetical protein
MEALVILSPFLGAAVLVGIAWWLERTTRRPGLFFLICGVVLLVGAGLGLTWGTPFQRLLALILGVNAIGCLYMARWRQTSTGADHADATKR